MRLIDADALKREKRMADRCEDCERNARDCQYVYGYTLMDICSMLDDAPTVGDWISVKDRLPENETEVIIIVQHKIGWYRAFAWHDEYGWHSSAEEFGDGENDFVTYWTPLHEPPKEVTGDEP